ncbi:glycosyltransferase family 61 protein [Acinetobacter faecalis]|uniref:glycosyltransferase family 61 protein n=1 Tax=Acinetobacter faecalis TaxID=2665161 RepID=UPI002A91A7E1|nr:glycosyltransferase family 61 protein [Acinetobacter faecalis]MDY6449400.1 glycosyltransferase family 61 protein [Acinetobacter faecalis]
MKLKEIARNNIYIKLIYYFIKFNLGIKKLVWLDLKKEKKLILKGVLTKTYIPNFNLNQKSINITTPDVYVYYFNNVLGHIESSSFYDQRKIFVERFYGIKQDVAKYSTGNIVAHNQDYALIFKHKNSISINDNVFFLGGNGVSNYFHWLVEILPKLVFLAKNESILNSISSIVVHENIKKIKSLYDSLIVIMRVYGIDKTIIYVNNQTSIKFKNVLYMSTFNHVLFNFKGNCNKNYTYFLKSSLLEMSDAYKIKIKNSIDFCSKKFPSKFFIRRGAGVSSYNKRNYNEDDISRTLKKFNIVDIYIENYSFEEQIFLFSNAKFIVAPSGAFLTNLIFCKKETVIISWLSSNVSEFSVYSTLACFFDLKMHFIYSDQSVGESLHGKYYLNPSSLEKKIIEILN